MLRPARIKRGSQLRLLFSQVPTAYVAREHNALGGSVLLALAATATSDGGNQPDVLAFVVAVAPLLVLLPLLFFAVRWQMRLFKDLQHSLHRIADAIERMASRQ